MGVWLSSYGLCFYLSKFKMVTLTIHSLVSNKNMGHLKHVSMEKLKKVKTKLYTLKSNTDTLAKLKEITDK